MWYICPNSACGREIEAEVDHVGDDLAEVHFKCACGFARTMILGSNEGRVIWPSQDEFEGDASPSIFEEFALR